jgi:hypothetical protein
MSVHIILAPDVLVYKDVLSLVAEDYVDFLGSRTADVRS